MTLIEMDGRALHLGSPDDGGAGAGMGVFPQASLENFFTVSAGLPFSAGFLKSVGNEVADMRIRVIERKDICVLPLELQRDNSPNSPQPSSFGFLVLVCPSNLRSTTPRVNLERSDDGRLSLGFENAIRGWDRPVKLPALRGSADDCYIDGRDTGQIIGIEVSQDQLIIGPLPHDNSVVSALIVAVDSDKYDEEGNSWHPGALKLRQVFAGDDEVFVARSARIPEWEEKQKGRPPTMREIIFERLAKLEKRNKGRKTKGEMGELRAESNKGKHKKRKSRERKSRRW